LLPLEKRKKKLLTDRQNQWIMVNYEIEYFAILLGSV
jgi:hypothetical protein